MKPTPAPLADLRVLLLEQGITLWRRKWLAVAVCWLTCVLGWSAVMVMPRQYESDTRAYIDVDGLLGPLLKGLVVDTNTAQANDYLRRTLLSRPNLEQVSHLAELDIGKTDIEKEALIGRLGSTVRITAEARNLVRISYQDADPLVAKNVVEALLTLFAENAARSSRVEMERAREFLDDQIAKYEEQLRAAEKRRADFRKQYSQAIADPISGVPRLQNLQQQLVQAQQKYRETVTTRDSLAAQLAQVPQFLSVDASPTVAPDGSIVAASSAVRLARARANLSQLRLKFTEQYPDVVAAQRAVTELEAALAAGSNPSSESKTQITNPIYEQIRTKLVDAETAVPAAQQYLDQAVADFERTRALTATVPDIDAKALDLDRDYGIIKKNHDELIARRESATLSQAADDEADRTQFRIVDPPLVPRRPTSPNLPLMFSLVLFGGLGVGIGLPLALGQIWTTFSSVARLRELGLPVIGCVTYARRPWAKRGQALAAAGAMTALAALLIIYGALMILSATAYQSIIL